MTVETIEDRVVRYVAARRDRDQLVKDLKAAGWGPSKISRALGLGRATVGRILGATWTQNHGHGYQTPPRNVSHETSAARITDMVLRSAYGRKRERTATGHRTGNRDPAAPQVPRRGTAIYQEEGN